MRAQPLIAVFFAVPLLAEALREALDELGEVRSFASPAEDPLRLLEAVGPDAVVVDGERDADAALAYSRETGTPAFYLPPDGAELLSACGAGWLSVAGGQQPHAIRNAVAGALGERVT